MKTNSLVALSLLALVALGATLNAAALPTVEVVVFTAPPTALPTFPSRPPPFLCGELERAPVDVPVDHHHVPAARVGVVEPVVGDHDPVARGAVLAVVRVGRGLGERHPEQGPDRHRRGGEVASERQRLGADLHERRLDARRARVQDADLAVLPVATGAGELADAGAHLAT